MGSTYSLSETGWAGPTGPDGTSEEGVGKVYFGIVGPRRQKTIAGGLGPNIDPSDRAGNMAKFAKMALEFLLAYLEKEPLEN